MNTQLETFELKVEGHQVVEAVASIFETVLFHRCLGKFGHRPDGDKGGGGGGYYAKGTVGYMEVDCDFVDLTYVACSSPTLNAHLKRTITQFADELRFGNSSLANTTTTTTTGQIALEFFEKKRRPRWQLYPYPGVIPWEIWSINIELAKHTTQLQHVKFREQLNEILVEKLQLVAQLLNNSTRYLPEMPKPGELDCVFDTSYPDVSPYNFRVSYDAQNCTSLIKDTLRHFLYRNILN